MNDINRKLQNEKTVEKEGGQRIEVLKTYKIYVGGKFPRSESGRYYKPHNASGQPLGNMCLCTRKDFRDAMLTARSAQCGWAGRAAFNRGQVLYRIAEMLEGRTEQFVAELKKQGSTAKQALSEVETSVDRLIYYAGWCDKYQQVNGSVNPVATSHFNFSVPEPMGVIAAIAPEKSSLLGLVSIIAPVIAGGNSIIILASENQPLCAVTFAEVLQTSDVPGGVVNILTGTAKELLPHFSSHMDVNAIIYGRDDDPALAKEKKEMQLAAVENLKRVITPADYKDKKAESMHELLKTQEIKTTWHPIESVGSAGSGY